MSFIPDAPSTEDVLAVVLASTLPQLPPQEQRLGATTISWWETAPGEVYIHAEGGTPDDRHYSATLVGLQLEPHGYRRAQFGLDAEDWLRNRGDRPGHVLCPQCGRDYIHALGPDGKSRIGCGSCGYQVGLDDLEGMLQDKPVQIRYKLPIIDPSTNGLGPRREGSADVEHPGSRRTTSRAPEPPNYRKATGKDHCGSCEMFDKGICWGYGNKSVKSRFVCDSFAPEEPADA